MISVIVVAALAICAWEQYTLFIEEPPEGEQPIERLLRDRDVKDATRAEMQTLLEVLPGASSVWLYSWPDARHLNPLIGVGEGPDPMPLGYLRYGDESAIGHFVLAQCTRLPRNFVNISCPIVGVEDSWGVLIVVYDEEPPNRPEAVKIVAEKVSSILYHSKS